MKLLKLSGKYAVGEYEYTMVDDEDYERLIKKCWNIQIQKPYQKPMVNIRASHKSKLVLIHKFILNFPEKTVDHIDRNRLNNQKNNLRLVNRSQHSRNRSSALNSSSKYLGIFWNKGKNKWTVKMNYNYKTVFLGYFTDEIKAAETYDLYSLKYWGEYVNLNFPDKKDYYISKFDEIDINKEKKCSSLYTGVSKKDTLWQSSIGINNKLIYIGIFKNEIDAAKAYDQKVKEFGLNRKLNFP